jgi:radical SAM protein with 4Fe4S-binding SPASM domain
MGGEGAKTDGGPLGLEVGGPGIEGKPQRLEDSKIKEMIDEGAALGQCAVGFGGLWEPLLFKGLPGVVAHARGRGLVDALLNTNGSLLTRELAGDLIESGLTRLMVSLDAASDSTYRLMRPGGELGAVEENIEGFLCERERRKSRLPLLRLSFLVTSLNEGELPAFLSRWENRADFFSVQRYGFYKGRGREGLFPKNNPPVPQNAVCAQPFKRVLVRHDGSVLPCCDLSAINMPVGNIYQESIKEIWDGEKISKLRESVRNPKKLPPTCRDCQSKYA